MSDERWHPIERRPGTQDPMQFVDDELRHHIEGRAEELMAEGWSEAEALREAQRRFGDPAAVARQCRAEATAGAPSRRGGDGWGAVLGQDVRMAVRSARRRPSFAAAVIGTLALAISATTAVFTAVNGVLLQPLNHPHPEELVQLWEVDERPGFFNDHNRITPAAYHDWREQNRVFQHLSAFQTYPMTVVVDGNAEQVSGARATAEFFTTLGTDAAVGRLFVAGDDAPDAARVVVLGHDFWRARFGGDPSVIGATLSVASSPFSIVGVLPPDFEFLDDRLDVVVPIRFSPEGRTNRTSHMLWSVARLAPDVTREQAQADMERIVDGLRDAYPESMTGYGVNVTSMTDEVVGAVRPALIVLLAAVGFVMAIACVNVANLMLTRAVSDQRELAIRSALGAGHGRLIRQRLTEGLVLSVTGGGLGLAGAHAIMAFLLRAAPDTLPRGDAIGVDARVWGFAAAISVLTGLVVGALPALYTSRLGTAGVLREGGRAHTGARMGQRIRSGFVVAQLAFSLVLLVSAGLMIATFARLTSVDPGFDATDRLSFRVTLPSAGYSAIPAQRAFLTERLRELEALPGVRTVGLTRFLPLLDEEWSWSAYIEGRPEPDPGEKIDYGYHPVSDGYFETMGIALRRGRLFTEADRDDSPLVLVVNEAFVDRFFPDGADPIGQRMNILGRRDVWMEIVGIVENVHHYALDTDPLPLYYGSYRQVWWDFLLRQTSIVLRSDGDPLSLANAARAIVRDADPLVVVSELDTMAGRVAQSVARTRFAMMLLGAFATVAAALALIGIYGVISYAVGRRAQEIGVRIALGARPPRIVGQFLTHALGLAAIGIALGVVGAAVFTRLQASLLYGVEPLDAEIYIGVSGLLGGIAVLGALIPARRASRVDPATVLREE